MKLKELSNLIIQAQFNPLKFLKDISSDLVIYENTRALEIKENLVITNRGNITANNIVVATHYPIMNAPDIIS